MRRVALACRGWVLGHRRLFVALLCGRFRLEAQRDLPDLPGIGEATGELAVHPDRRSVAAGVVLEVELDLALREGRVVALPALKPGRDLFMVVEAAALVEEGHEPIDEIIAPPDLEEADVGFFELCGDIEAQPAVGIDIDLAFRLPLGDAPDMVVPLPDGPHLHADHVVRRRGIDLHEARCGRMEGDAHAHRVASVIHGERIVASRRRASGAGCRGYGAKYKGQSEMLHATYCSK